MVRPGDLVGERFQVIELIASGGMGTLWRAHHVELDVDVALKVIPSGAQNPSALKRFKHEARAAARLRSPNIVQVLDYGIHGVEQEPYLVMELLKGEDLATRIRREGKLGAEAAQKVVDGVTKAIQLAHDSDIVHRDLKPANIFLEKVGEDEIVKVLDFGIAKDLTAPPDPAGTTSTGAVGSPSYMSPEQVWGEKVGPTTDLWALGVVSFEMLTGKNPFVDDTLAKVYDRIIRAPLPKLSDHFTGFPESLEPFFARAFARSANDRIPSAREFAQEFRQALAHSAPGSPILSLHPKERSGPVSPHATTQVAKHSGSASTSRRWMALAAVITVLVLAGFFFWDRPQAPLDTDLPGGERPAAANSSATLTESLTPVATTVHLPPTASVEAAPSVPSPNASPAHTPEARSPGPKPLTSTQPKASSAPQNAGTDPQFGIPLAH